MKLLFSIFTFLLFSMSGYSITGIRCEKDLAFNNFYTKIEIIKNESQLYNFSYEEVGTSPFTGEKFSEVFAAKELECENSLDNSVVCKDAKGLKVKYSDVKNFLFKINDPVFGKKRLEFEKHECVRIL